MSIWIYGVQSQTNGHIDLSANLRAAKSMATRGGYTTLTKRNVVSLAVVIVCHKVGNKWVDGAPKDE